VKRTRHLETAGRHHLKALSYRLSYFRTGAARHEGHADGNETLVVQYYRTIPIINRKAF
jgi:hypothetical protein